MKNRFKTVMPNFIFNRILTMVLISTVFACNKDDSSEMENIPEEETIFGKWKIQEGFFSTEESKYVLINDDYSIDILSEDNMGFKRIGQSLKIESNDKIVPISRFSRDENYHYSLNNTMLTITRDDDGNTVTLLKDKNAPSTHDWVKTLSIIDQADAPWNRNVDIAYNGSMLLFPNGYEEQNIGLINTNTLIMVDNWSTDINTYAVEIEKLEGGDGPVTFQALENEAKINVYNTNNYTQIHNSKELGIVRELEGISFVTSPAITGIASVGNKTIWVSNSHSQQLFLYDYTGLGTILSQESLSFTPYGLDFQSNYLYVSDGSRLHKCQTAPIFKAIESYKIPGHNIFGIAFDGENFWLNVQKLPEEESILGGSETDNKLMKVNLSL